MGERLCLQMVTEGSGWKQLEADAGVAEWVANSKDS